MLACENIRFSSLFVDGDVPPRETSPAAKSEEKRMFSQAKFMHSFPFWSYTLGCRPGGGEAGYSL